ncbi:MAG: hypothetical protein PHD72_01835 [Patescibacteria group bacterium]|nr:hypothetical protein [Patescibacteria group bacterium]
MLNGETTINELMEFLQDNMVTKEDAEVFATKDDLKAFATKDDLKAFATKDDFIRLEQNIEQVHLSLSGQISMIERELKDIKERLARLEKRTIEDADAAAEDVLELRRRVEVLEEKFRQLQPV